MFEKLEQVERVDDKIKASEVLVCRESEKAIKDGELLGGGQTANVYRLKEDKNLCLKFIHSQNISFNRVIKEEEFLDILFRERLPVPRPFCAVEAKDGHDYLLMETIEGFSLRDLVQKDLIDSLPEHFDLKGFFEKLNFIVEKMHILKIYHRDLHDGNVMVDKEGNPVIIDFGDAVLNYFSDEDPYRQKSSSGMVKVYPRDEDNILASRRKVVDYMKSKL